MNASEALEKLLRSYEQYYDIRRAGVTEPFAAECAFHSHQQQYFLTRRATISEAESHEYVFFAAEERLTLPMARRMDFTAWETGAARVDAHPNHRNTDVTLVVLAQRIDPDAAAFLKKLRRYKSYGHMLRGWSSYRVIALELSTGTLTSNRLGRDLRKLLRNIVPAA
ncbi:MAG: hypothetical protein IKI17_02885 [Oscillospiraceae bacterium]|nr:hypothetical protein [Oscillospiraceae bacterium]